MSLLRERRGEITEALRLGFLSPAFVRLDLEVALASLSGEHQSITSLAHVSLRFVIFEIVNDVVIFSFDDAPLEDAADLRRRIQEERPE